MAPTGRTITTSGCDATGRTRRGAAGAREAALTRDLRFVAADRGGRLDLSSHRLLAVWAAECAEHAQPLFDAACPHDDRPRLGVEAARAWSHGEVSAGDARAAAVAAHAAAREAPANGPREAARAAGHAAATAHMAGHSLAAALYAVRAVVRAAPPGEVAAAGAREERWQTERLPEAIRDLVVSARSQQPAFR